MLVNVFTFVTCGVLSEAREDMLVGSCVMIVVLVDWLGEVVINLPFIVFVDCENEAFVE